MRQKSTNYLLLFVFCFLGFLDRSYAACLLDWSGAGQMPTATVTQGFFALPIQVTRKDVSPSDKCTGAPTPYFFNIRNTYNNGNVVKYLYLDGIQTNDSTKRIEVYFYKQANTSSEILSNSPITGTVNNTGTSFSYYTYINPATNFAALVPGTYSGNYGITLAQTVNGNIDNSADKSQVIQIIFGVNPPNPVVNISLLPSGTTTFNISATAYTLDFVTLSEGAERDFNVVIQYNTKYKIGFKSPTNLGKLKNTSGAATIDYEMNVENTGYFTLNTEKFPAVTTDSSVAVNQPTATKFFNVKVRINNVPGNVVGKPSGDYSDKVTITISGL